MSDAHMDHDYGQQLSNPPHVQKIERALRLEPFLSYVEELVQPVIESDPDSEIKKPCLKDEEGNKILNGIQITKAGKEKHIGYKMLGFPSITTKTPFLVQMICLSFLLL